MRCSRILIVFTLAFLGLSLLIFTMGAASQAEPSQQTAAQPDNTIIPMGPAQPNVRQAYWDMLTHLYGDGRVHWAASSVLTPNVQPGDFIIPGGLDTTADHADVTTTLPLSRAYAVRPGKVALLRSTVVVTQGQNQYVAMWELADVRQFLDGYLFGSLPYTVLDEAAIISGGLEGVDLLIVPAIRPDVLLTVTDALSRTGALAAIKTFVEAGGTLYAQSNGAYVAEAAGLLPPGTVDLQHTISLDGDDANRGLLAIQNPASPLAWSWLTNTLYILTDPQLHPAGAMETIATLTNAGDVPAIVRAQAGEGQIIMIVGHPTSEASRLQAPLFMDAVWLSLASRAELTGDAIQTFNPGYNPHEFPAYERVPISVALTASNLWDVTITNAILTETVSNGYAVSATTIFPTPTHVYTVTSPTTATTIVWNLGELGPGTEFQLGYWARSEPDALAAGVGTFSTGEMSYEDAELGSVTVAHRPFVLTAQMPARLVGDRDLEADRHYRIPSEGIYLDVALPLENKEWTSATNVVITDWVYLIHPIVDLENQHVILSANDGETIWLLNEPFLWQNKPYPLPVGAPSPTHTYTLADWKGDRCVFTSTFGIHIDPPPAGYRPLTKDYGSFITIPPTYTQYITVTPDHKLLLPCLPLTFDLGNWPGYWYEEPAMRYGVHSRELFSRTVVFHGTPRPTPGAVVMPYDAGSVYVAAGADPVPFREYLTASVPYAAAAPAQTGVTYQDVWSRTHFTPFRATFYDVWDWDSCATCGGNVREQHAAINLTFGLTADLDGDGTPETPVREIPTRLPKTWVTLMGKSYNLGQWTIPSNMNLIELPIFHGLGIQIQPRNGDWFHSYTSPSGNTTLVAVTPTLAYDNLYFQQDVPPGVAEIFYVDGNILTYNFDREGMFKLHDGARLIYRQMLAGPNRYEIYDSHVHSVMGYSSDGQITGHAGPTAVSVYGDSIYYLYQVNDRYDPRPFNQDPYMNSWGYGDFVATSYMGGREDKTLFRSIVASNERTRARISLDNNTGVTLTNVSVAIGTPAWITITKLYTDPNTAPEPIWSELAFLNVATIPDAWRGVYYFDLHIGAIPTDLVGSVITLPVHISADGLPSDYTAPPLVLALQDAGGSVPKITLGPARDLTLTDTLLANIALHGAAVVTEAQGIALMNKTDYDALHPLSDTAASLFATFAHTLPFTVANEVASYELPEAWRTLPASETLYVAASGTITHAHHGPNQVSAGGDICYTDLFGLRWCDQGQPLFAEATGANVSVTYFCEGVSAGVSDDGAGHCTVPPDQTSQIRVRLTASNEGDKLASNVTATTELPTGVARVGNADILDFGDIAPGGWASKWVTLQVTPTTNAIGDGQSGWVFPVVNRTWGQFFDTASQRMISGQFGDSFAINVLWKPRWVYLPITLHNFDSRADLAITALAVNANVPSDLHITIVNRGHTAAQDFWVDLYLDPPRPPEVNEPWTKLRPDWYGAAWFVGELSPGATLVLTIGDEFYVGDQSRWPTETYPAGNHAIWAYADSLGGNSWGAVNESDEANNRYGPVSFVGTGAMLDDADTLQFEPIPPRPMRP